jgi:DNA-binding protein H-NS
MPRKISKNALATQFKKLQASMRDVVREWEKTIAIVVKKIEKRDLALAKANKRTKRRKLPKVPVKYRDKRGNTWTGRGRPARWIVAAEKAGKKRESFRV